MIQQPLSDLAVEIIREARTSDKQQYVFASPLGDLPLNLRVMATALRGTKAKGKVSTPVRRSRRTICGERRRPWREISGFDDAWIAKCLDHAASKKSEQIVPSVTGKVYNHSKRMKEKRAVLDGVAAELRRIISSPVETGLRLVA